MQILSDDMVLAGAQRKLYQGIIVTATVALAVWGGWQMLDIVNPVTVIATAEDVQAMSWIRENVARDAVFLINTRRWQYDRHRLVMVTQFSSRVKQVPWRGTTRTTCLKLSRW